MTHTPAPWRFNGNWLESKTSQDMILTYTTADDGLHGTDADKALIAAAPDLLEALESLLAECDPGDGAIYCPGDLDTARAAIAKARAS